jgi:hypothetical protein
MTTETRAASGNVARSDDTVANTQAPARPAKRGSDKVVALNFRVAPDFKKAFKIAAATQGITQSDLLQQAFDEWRQRHG